MPELGTKHACYSCQTKFYDLGKKEPICPKCGADQREAPEEAETGTGGRSKRKKRSTKKKKKKAKKSRKKSSDDEDSDDDSDNEEE